MSIVPSGNLPPVVESGTQTTEFWLATVASAATLTGTILVDFGVAALNGAQRADITAAGILGVSIIVGLYSLARGIRKQGL